MTILSRLQSVWQSLELREKLVRGKADVRMREHAKVVILRRPADALDFRRRPRKSELHESEVNEQSILITSLSSMFSVVTAHAAQNSRELNNVHFPPLRHSAKDHVTKKRRALATRM